MNNIFHDIATRTNKELYIGVVGAVRTGKSTFIKRFIEAKVLKMVDSETIKNKIVDELPHSAQGKNIMTMEPKFVPNNAINVSIKEDLDVNVRLVDCVGYVISGATGHYTEDGPRMVKTPWFEDEIPFIEAAEVGTNKVINNHSNIGIIMTTDGTVTDFSRDDYIEVEDRIIKQMKDLDKPFVVVLNTLSPSDDNTKQIQKQIEERHDVRVVACNVESMNENDIDKILRESLNEFKINQLNIRVPSYISALNDDNRHKVYVNSAIEKSTQNFTKMKDAYKIQESLKTYEGFSEVKLSNIDISRGDIDLSIEMQQDTYNTIINEIIGEEITTKGEFVKTLQDFRIAKDEYDQIKDALSSVKETGYGVSMPKVTGMKLEEPVIIKQSGRYGVKLKAVAPSIHMIKVDVDSIFEPIIGTEDQSKALIDNLLTTNERDSDVWSSEIFGRRLSDVVNDGIRSKLYLLPENAKDKFRGALEKVVNQGSGRLIAIIL